MFCLRRIPFCVSSRVRGNWNQVISESNKMTPVFAGDLLVFKNNIFASLLKA
jgi:hypothetical protein